MAQVLTRQNLRFTRFLRDEMFRCIRRGGENPTDGDWMLTTYMSRELENRVELGIRDTHKLFRIIKPFTERLFRSTFHHRRSINRDYMLCFKIEIFTRGGFVEVGEFYYRSDCDPFELEMEGIKRNWNLYYHLNQSFSIFINTGFVRLPPTLTLQLIPPTHNPDDVESSSPKPLKKIFKENQCIICLDRKPNVLFVKCRHTCVCEECEEAHPSTKCPCCRKEISEKLLI